MLREGIGYDSVSHSCGLGSGRLYIVSYSCTYSMFTFAATTPPTEVSGKGRYHLERHRSARSHGMAMYINLGVGARNQITHQQPPVTASRPLHYTQFIAPTHLQAITMKLLDITTSTALLATLLLDQACRGLRRRQYRDRQRRRGPSFEGQRREHLRRPRREF
jgi:hypothetical protein